MKKPPEISTSHTRVPASECSLAKAIRVVGDMWTLLILREIICGAERFDQIREDLGITRSVLSNRLARLVQEGILERYQYRDSGQRARKGYTLTEKGRALLPVVITLREWGGQHLEPGNTSLRLQLQTTDGLRVETKLIREDGLEVSDMSGVVATVKE